MLLSMGAVFAFIFWILLLVLKKFIGQPYDKNLGLVHFNYIIIGVNLTLLSNALF